MIAGAFSNDDAVTAAEDVVAIKVDCTDPDQNVEVQDLYDVQGYPTVLFVTNDETKVEDLSPDDGKAFARQIRSFAAKHTVWIRGWEGAISLGARLKKPAAILMPSEEIKDWDGVKASLAKELGDDLGKFVFGYARPGSKERETLEARLPRKERKDALVVVDPRTPDGFKMPLADMGPSNRTAAMKQILKDWKKESP